MLERLISGPGKELLASGLLRLRALGDVNKDFKGFRVYSKPRVCYGVGLQGVSGASGSSLESSATVEQLSC